MAETAAWDAVSMSDVIWIERLGDGTWGLRIHPDHEHPAGRVERLSRFVSLDDAATLAEIDQVVGAWGWRREEHLSIWRDEVGRLQVPVTPAGR